MTKAFSRSRAVLQRLSLESARQEVGKYPMVYCGGDRADSRTMWDEGGEKLCQQAGRKRMVSEGIS